MSGEGEVDGAIGTEGEIDGLADITGTDAASWLDEEIG